MSDLIKLSVSKSATFQSCKKKYHFAYVLKLPRKEYTYHTFGRFAHRILELFHLYYINGSTNSHKQNMGIAFNEAMSEFKGKITQEFKDEAFNIMLQYLARPNLAQEIKRVFSVEKVFNLDINEKLILTGMIDRVQLDDDGIYHVLDYKTSKSKTYLKDDTLQLLTYAYILLNEHPEIKKVRVSYIMLRHNCEFLTKEFDLPEILTVKDIYQSYANNILNETEFAPKPQVLCRFCDFADVCEAGREHIAKQYVTGAITYGKKV